MTKNLWLLSLLLVGCATAVSSGLNGIRPGMDKDKVLDSAGNPQRTFREAMQDHWIYIYFLNDREWHREIVFEGGKVLKITRPMSGEDWTKDLEKSDSMEEYEQKAREHEKKAGNFKSIDGLPDEPGDK